MRDRSIDIAKGIGIILMVVGHADAPTSLKIWIYGFHMPLFFIIAGYTFNKKKWIENGFAKLLQNRARKYLVPYFFMFFINLLIWQTLVLYKTGGVQLLDWILAGIYSHDTLMPNCAPLWFLTCLFVSYVFFYVNIKQTSTISQIVLSMVQIAALLIICKFEREYNITQLPWHIDVALISSIFMLIGYYFKEKILIKKLKPLISFSLLLTGTVIILANKKINMVQNQYNNIVLFFLGAILLSVVILYLSFYISKKERSSCLVYRLEFLGKNTIIFIGFNYIINTIVRQMLKLMSVNSKIIYCIIDTIIVVLCCTAIAYIWNKIKNYAKSVA